LMSVGGARIVTGKEISSVLEPSNPTYFTTWSFFQLCSDQAAGKIYQWLNKGNKIYMDNICDKPALMWVKPHEIHSKFVPNAHFNSLSNLFTVLLHEEETLTQLFTCVKGAMQHIWSLCSLPITNSDGTITVTYTLEMLDDKLCTMAMLCALPWEDYGPFVSSVLMLNNLAKDTIKEAFHTKETQHATAAKEVTTAACVIVCYLCKKEHKITKCPYLATAQSHINKYDLYKSRKCGGCQEGNNAAKANAAKASTSPKVEESCNGSTEKANAAIFHSLLSSPYPLIGFGTQTWTPQVI
ncbi:hypothetical protein J132_02724, partial [Termitomyces sp. J132]